MLPLLIICFLIALIIIRSIKVQPEFVKDQYPIKYPLEPMMDNYKSIITEISECKNERDFNASYLRIVIFQGCYPKDGKYLHELWNYLEERLSELNIFL